MLEPFYRAQQNIMKKSFEVSPRICIIGAGPSGITTAKNLLQQGLRNFVVFEKNYRLGGNWNFDENNDHSSVYETTHIISSKRLSEYEDFPMPADYPDYPSHSQILDYFNSYADYFGIKKHIQFNTCVEKIQPLADEKWQLIYRDENGEHETIYDYIFIANGHHWDPFVPDYYGEFTGTILHAHQYKKAAPFKDKKVLVVGVGILLVTLPLKLPGFLQKPAFPCGVGSIFFPNLFLENRQILCFQSLKDCRVG